jgi:GTP pyrophosphokinase
LIEFTSIELPSKTTERRAEQPSFAPQVESLDDVVARLRDHGREVDRNWLHEVYEYAREQHGNQTRRSGEPYITHPLAVAYLLADLKFDQTCVAVALLHDVLEDTGVSKKALGDRFGTEIADLVDGVSKIGRHEYVRRDDAQAETFRKLILASARDLRVIMVKLVDRWHNMLTLGSMRKESQRRISRETLEIYAPISHRLGISKVKRELEDLAFYHLYPHQFDELQEKVREKIAAGQQAREVISAELGKALHEAELEGEISHRIKGYYSIYQKLRRQGIDISELYDYLAFRMIVPQVRDCYAVLGAVHQSWRPIPGKFKDYIAVPKPNLYQSLHTTVVGEHGEPFEIQIRTKEMDAVAEEGIAAHWRYKEGRLEGNSTDAGIVWLRQLLEWQQDVSDPRAFLQTLKIDLYPEEVYVFTPKGEIMSFPRGATPLDFAYRVHTELGHHCSGARVSGRLVPLRTQLQSGDIVEILTNPNRRPSRDWLKIVATPRAKSKIRHWLNTQQRERAIEIGRTLLEKELKRYKLSLKRVSGTPAFDQFLKDEGLNEEDELLARVGFGKLGVRNVAQRLLTDQQLERESQPGRLRQVVDKLLPFGDGSVVVRGQSDLLAYLAKCCSPLPGDEIVGYVTRGRGVSVHAAECPNVRNLLYHPEREIEVAWARRDEGRYEIGLLIDCADTPGMLARLTEVISKHEGNIRQFEATTSEMGRAEIAMRIEVQNRKHLERVQRGLAGLKGVHDVRRRMDGGAERENAS